MLNPWYPLLLVLSALASATTIADEPVSEIVNSVGMKLQLIEHGKFLMGVPRDEYGRLDDNELPQHEVSVSRDYYLGVHEATQAQYKTVMGENPSYFRNSPDSNRLPVENVTWHQAQEFCNRLSARPEEKSNERVYRLPTEAEWEMACRGGSTTAYGFGDDRRELSNYAWYSENSNERTHPVGSKAANAFGLYDMHGNVSEWCSNWMGKYPNSPAVDPRGPSSGKFKVIRGKSFNHWAVHNRSGVRSEQAPDAALWTVCFRVVLEAPEKLKR
jgi:formylglycine-generating enzyme required for sulfatase activity